MKYIHDHPRALALTIWIVIFTLISIFGLLTSGSEGPAPDGPSLPTYTDPVSGGIYTIPEGITLADSGMKGEMSYARFSFDGVDSPFIYLTCEDAWKEISDEFTYYTSRGQADDTVYRSFDVSYEYGISLLQVNERIWANGQYYCITLPNNARSPHSGLPGPATVFLHYWNGYQIEFWFSDDEESPYLPLMEELAESAIFVHPSKLITGFSAATFAYALIVSFLGCQMFRLSIKQAGEITAKTRRRAIFHGVLAVSLFMPGALGLFVLYDDDGIILFLICAVTTLNYALSYPGKKKKLPNRIVLPPALRLCTHHRIILLANALIFLWRGTSRIDLLLFGTDVLLLALSCALPRFIYHSSLRENFEADRKAKTRAHLRGALVYGLIALVAWLLSLLRPISLVPLLFSLVFSLLPLTERPTESKPEYK